VPKKTNKSSDRYEHSAGYEYEGLGFNNKTVHAENMHNEGYVKTPPEGRGRAFLVQATSVTPGTKKRRMGGFD